ncbi:Protein FAR1-RELATED SEQUENCE 6 [Striga hermonthica]|uniref:Protein FAR1-RELATED SEQUENCE n=1 Tax=Striga hermonthica TaxID=68872 RepID=A0A9N7MVB3_STRHE|nr:Protein FAR1-RELATED SEQUENCE 6 [Striga hermonthica]
MDEASVNGEHPPLFTAMTEYVGRTGRVLPGDKPLQPAFGMEFESYEDVYFFYNCYARHSYKSHWAVGVGSKRPVAENGGGKIRLFRTVVVDEVDARVLDLDEAGIGAKLSLEKGYAREMVDFFTRMQLGDPSFFYVMDVNGRGCSMNVFWAEGKCRAAYGYFGDVVFIDAKALVGRYKIPLVVFTGVNHHGQTLPLGCGLVLGQTVDSFVWLLRAWLTYMVGRTPKTVITSWFEFLQAAVAEVLPRAFHCLDLRNIVDMVLSEFKVFEEFDAIRKAFTGAVFHSLCENEFEAAWEEMVQRHGLSSCDSIKALYEERKRWAPVYLKEVFLAVMFPVKKKGAVDFTFREMLEPGYFPPRISWQLRACYI